MQFLSEETHTPEQLFDEIEKLNHLEGISIRGKNYSLFINLNQSTYHIDIFQTIPEDRLTTKSIIHQAEGIENTDLKELFAGACLPDAASVINHLNARLFSSTEKTISKELADAKDKEMEVIMEGGEWELSAEAKQLEVSSPEEHKIILNSYGDKLNQIYELIDELEAVEKAKEDQKNAEIEADIKKLRSQIPAPGPGLRTAEFEAELQKILSQSPVPALSTPNLITSSTYSYTSKLDGNGIDIYTKNLNMHLISRYSKISIDYSQLVSCELCVDSETVIKTSRLGQIGGALLGGVLAGGVGALVGSGGAQKIEVANIRNIEVKILTTNHDRPIHIINFFKHGDGWFSFPPSNADIANAQKLHDLLAIAIHESKSNHTQANSSAPTTAPQHSLADELSKLADLKNQGFITDVEFTTAKLKLLS
jgi:hypothetical protein